MKNISAGGRLHRLFSFLLLAFCVAFGATAFGRGQTGGKPAAQKGALEKGKWRVTASKGVPQTFRVRANEATVTDVANELARLLKVPVSVSPALSKRTVNLDASGLTLEPTLLLLAPKVFADYELGGDMAQPKLLAAYLMAASDEPPAHGETAKAEAEAILIEGDTEEGTEEYEKRKEQHEQYLKVTYDSNHLSVVARKQPLSIVLYKVATELGVPFDLRYESTELVDIDFKKYPLDVAIRNLAPTARLYYRADLQTSAIQPLRVALVAPASVRAESKP